MYQNLLTNNLNENDVNYYNLKERTYAGMHFMIGIVWGIYKIYFILSVLFKVLILYS